MRAWGSNERELFSRSLLALAGVLRPDVLSLHAPDMTLRILVSGNGPADLLQKFLSRVLFESEMQDSVFPAMHIIECAPEEIDCELIGKAVDHFEEEMENARIVVTDMKRPSPSRWEAEFILKDHG